MRILSVIGNMDEESGGGATERTRQMSIHLSKMGHKVSVLTTDYRLTPASCVALGTVRLITLPCINARFYVPLPLFGQINEAIKQAEIIHLVNHWTLINAMAFVFARIHKKPYVLSPLGSLPIYGRSSLLKKIFNFLIGKRIIREASACIVATLSESPTLRSFGVDDSRIVHIPNGINAEEYSELGGDDLREKVGVYENPFILFIGRLNHIKGPDLLLEAFRKVKDRFSDIHLVYIGTDEGMLDSLQKMASSGSVLERVHFPGYIGGANKSRIIHSSLFLAVPSRQEAMSIVVLESGISGRPVLITDQCGFDEVEKVNGGLVVPATIDGLAQGLEEMLSQVREIEPMGDRLQQFVRENYLWSSIARQYLTLFEKISQ